MDLYAKAVQELAEIDAKLADLVPLQRRRAQLMPFVEMGKALQSGEQGSATSDLSTASRPSAAPRKGGTAKDRIIEMAERAIASVGYVSTADLLKLLEEQGLEIGSDNKMLAVSSVLSREKDKFKSDRAAGGWVLVAPHKEETPTGAPTPEGA